MFDDRWRVHLLPADTPTPAEPMPFVSALPAGWEQWLAGSGIPAGTPFLMSPGYEFDVELNAFFSSAEMACAADNTRSGYARDLAAFLTFLWCSRDGTGWRDATEADHLAYLVWRRQDERGPRVDAATWDREVAAVNRFYRWQLSTGHVHASPIPQRPSRLFPAHLGRRSGGIGVDALTTPATYSHGASRERVEWLPPESYRQWRDVGMRGYTSAGLPVRRFRGRWAARNATFCDLMVRTGMRLGEQAALTVFEVPRSRGLGGYQRFWLPAVIAKGGSARWVYVPASVITELDAYALIDRAEAVEQAQADGRYRRMRRPLVIEDPAVAVVTRRTGAVSRIRVDQLYPHERRQLLIDGDHGLEPASFWLAETGAPMAVSSWKDLFREANRRCSEQGLAVRAHPHMLRHTFAVVTLEQLQRGHIAALAGATPEQRGHYTRVFGDPLDWVRRRLGHRSVETTQIYLHALGELEMATRMELVPADEPHPQELPLSDLRAGRPALSASRRA